MSPGAAAGSPPGVRARRSPPAALLGGKRIPAAGKSPEKGFPSQSLWQSNFFFFFFHFSLCFL